MANKKVENACMYSGSQIDLDNVKSWKHPMTGTTYAECPQCNNMSAVNKVKRSLRIHSAGQVADTFSIG
jgi:hypothetical protein